MSMTSIGAAPAAAPTLLDIAPPAPAAAGVLSTAAGAAPLSLFGQLLGLVDTAGAPDGAGPETEDSHGADEAAAAQADSTAATAAFSTLPQPGMLAALAPAIAAAPAAASAVAGQNPGGAGIAAIDANGGAPTHPALLAAQAEQQTRALAPQQGDAAARSALPLPPQLASQLQGNGQAAPAASERPAALPMPLAGQAAAGTRENAAPLLAELNTVQSGRSGDAQAAVKEAAGDAAQAGTGFKTLFANTAPQNGAGADSVKLAGAPEQWQQPLRAALGDRLQLQLQRNSDHAVIRLDPPNLGSVEISIRHTAGALQVTLSASHGEVLRQLNTIGDTMRQDLSQRQYGDVAVTVSASGRGQGFADADGRGRQPERDGQSGRQPGRALSEDGATSTFAMLSDLE
ncbi:flagellar hook-length control protein FliK [Massilia sp. YIM B04103]|uniref:flagellar hook-length control protein FliK n=1 Tax=Massilia sp. YIM B04103 TaxID=2963106 RepID=UPI0021099537|nr:flagellar hook-length control protein FliK [Massilia sp. YIM B04103]